MGGWVVGVKDKKKMLPEKRTGFNTLLFTGMQAVVVRQHRLNGFSLVRCVTAWTSKCIQVLTEKYWHRILLQKLKQTQGDEMPGSLPSVNAIFKILLLIVAPPSFFFFFNQANGRKSWLSVMSVKMHLDVSCNIIAKGPKSQTFWLHC